MAKRVAPNPYRSLRNAFFTHGIIRPYFDPGFDLNDFKAGARAAVQTVSKLLSQGDFDALEDLMEKVSHHNLLQFAFSNYEVSGPNIDQLMTG